MAEPLQRSRGAPSPTSSSKGVPDSFFGTLRPAQRGSQQLARLSRWLVDTVTFAGMPIRRKLLIFSTGVCFWFLTIGGFGMWAAGSLETVLLILLSILFATSLLVVFAVSITRSFTLPIRAMTRQIDSLLTSGEIDLEHRVTVQSRDEIGVLASKFNQLLHSIHELNTFRKVIEEDERAQDVYDRLSQAFTAMGLRCHQLYEVSRNNDHMRLMNTTCTQKPWCSPEICSEASRCRARKTGKVVSSVDYPHICKSFCADDRQHVCMPLTIGGHTGGVVQFVFSTERQEFALRTIGRAGRVIKEAVPVLEAKRLTDTLRDSAMRDPLTSLYNRRFLEQIEEKVVSLARRRGSTMALLMCDLDFFKEVNDQFGHTAGDVVLRECAAIISRSLRGSDFVVRYGGEEFLVVLQDSAHESGEQVAERIRTQVEGHIFSLEGGVLSRTVSVGVAELPTDSEQLAKCIEFADLAMYCAKAGGRNRVERFTPRMLAEDLAPTGEKAHAPSDLH